MVELNFFNFPACIFAKSSAINLDECLKKDNINMISCGGQSSIPICYAMKASNSDLNYIEVFFIGLCQVLAFIPGESRAGVTITGARILGVKRKSSAIFSMVLSIPIILSSLSLSMIDLFSKLSIEINLTQPIFAACIACITALISIHAMMKILQFTNFNIFIIYRIILGILLLIFYA